MPELVIISDREPTFDEWFASVDETINGRVLDMVGGGWHAVDTADEPVVTWWPGQLIGNPRAGEEVVQVSLTSGQVWTDILVPVTGSQGLLIAQRVADRVGGTLTRKV